MPTADRLVIRDVAIIDATGREPEGRTDVLVEDGRIAAIGLDGARVASGTATLDGAGTTLLPGLTDAHVHLALIGEGVGHGDDPWIIHVLAVAAMIERALHEGFTTVRDAGGLEPTWAHAVAAGRLHGPRLLPAGSPISQTGGHGDFRPHHHANTAPTIPGLVAGNEIVDGVDEVRKAAREQLRRGATQIKIMASGGITSPSDPFESVQLSVDEIAVATEVARGWGTYVMAHCLTSPAIEMALDAGVRSIEHATVLEAATAARMAREGAFMVPTLSILEYLLERPGGIDLVPEKVAKLRWAVEQADASIGIAREAGVSIASGSDLVGPGQGQRGRELVYKARSVGAHEAIISATRTNAELFGLSDEIGTVESGKLADLVLVKGEPLDDIEVLADPDDVVAVVQGGRVRKDSEERVRAG